MNSKDHPFLTSILTGLLAFCLLASTAGGMPLSLRQDPPADPDIIYSEDEVDIKAQILNLREINPIRSGVSRDCGDNAEVQLTMVLRKSGKVSDVKIVKAAKCSLDSKAIDSVKKIKFKQAEKEGLAVSQLSNISFRHSRVY